MVGFWNRGGHVAVLQIQVWCNYCSWQQDQIARQETLTHGDPWMATRHRDNTDGKPKRLFIVIGWSHSPNRIAMPSLLSFHSWSSFQSVKLSTGKSVQIFPRLLCTISDRSLILKGPKCCHSPLTSVKSLLPNKVIVRVWRLGCRYIWGPLFSHHNTI